MMKDFLQNHFSVLLVTCILIVMLLVLVIETHTTGNDAIITWLEERIGDALSAILMGLGGPKLNQMMQSNPVEPKGEPTK